MEENKLTIKEWKRLTKANLIKKLDSVKIKIENLYIKEAGEQKKPILYPIPQEIIELYKTIDKTINKLNKELEEERKQL